MDRRSEQFVIEILHTIRPRTGILLVTHRANLLRHLATSIVLLDAGKLSIKQQHAELLKTENIYSYYFKEHIVMDKSRELFAPTE